MQAAAQVEALDAQVPSGDLLVFLRAKRGTGEQGLFRLVNSRGLWTSTERSAVDAPLADESPTKEFASEISGFAEFADIVAYVRDAR